MHLCYGEHLKKAIRRHGYTQAQVADAIGTSRQSMSGWVNNRVDMPLYRLVDIADFLECTTDELLGRGDREPTYLDRVYESLNEDGRKSLLLSAEMHYMNPRFLPEGRVGEVRA